MIFTVLWDDESIYDETQDMTLINPQVEMELNSAGSFEFTISPGHRFYDSIKMEDVLCHTVDVYEGHPDDVTLQKTLIFTGRPVEITMNFYKQKTIHCEGALAYFNDTVQSPFTMDYDVDGNNATIYKFFKKLIDQHNAMVNNNPHKLLGNNSRSFQLGDIIGVTGSEYGGRQIYRKVDWNTTWDALESMCLSTEGGYFFIRREGDIFGEKRNYIDWKPDMKASQGQISETTGSAYYPTSEQWVQFGVNLSDLTQTMSGGDIVTCVVPLGKVVDEDIGYRLTIADVNQGKNWLADNELVQKYGYIFKTQSWDDIGNPSNLKIRGERWLKEEQYEKLVIECSAADLYYLDPQNRSPFRVGEYVRVMSDPHGMEITTLPMLKTSVNLNSGVKKITIGSPPHKNLTTITKGDS